MWSNVFAAKIAENDWDGAYSAAVLNPDKARSNDAIRRLVVVLCEKNLTPVLASFPLVGISSVVTELLAHKAQYADTPLYLFLLCVCACVCVCVCVCVVVCVEVLAHKAQYADTPLYLSFFFSRVSLC